MLRSQVPAVSYPLSNLGSSLLYDMTKNVIVDNFQLIFKERRIRTAYDWLMLIG
jgi:hypothetical protein